MKQTHMRFAGVYCHRHSIYTPYCEVKIYKYFLLEVQNALSSCVLIYEIDIVSRGPYWVCV